MNKYEDERLSGAGHIELLPGNLFFLIAAAMFIGFASGYFFRSLETYLIW